MRGRGRRSQDVLRVFSILVSKKEVNCEVVVDEKHFQVAVPTEGGFPGSGSESVQAVQAEPVAPWQVKILYDYDYDYLFVICLYMCMYSYRTFISYVPVFVTHICIQASSHCGYPA